MKDKRFPDGQCDDGRNIPDRGVSTGVTDNYGAGSGDLEKGFIGGKQIRRDTGSDK
jgi:hypothetical protein